MPMTAADNPFDAALRQLQDFGLEVAEVDTSGRVIRARHASDRPGKRNGWYVAHVVRCEEDREIVVGAYGWWKDPDRTLKFKVRFEGLSDSQRAEIQRRAAAAARQAEQARIDLAAEAARRAAEIWSKLPESGASPYLDHKGVRAFGLRFSRGSLVIPLRRADNTLVGLQFIDQDGGKRFLTGTAKAGAFHLLGDPGEAPRLIGIAEGYATAATVHLARRTQWPVAVAFDAGNLKPVALALRARWPEALIVILADDDRATPGNPGRTKAEAAVKAVGGAVLLPPLGDHPGTDWNDLQQAIGLEGVREALSEAWEAAKPRPPPRSNVVQLQTSQEWTARLQRNDKGTIRATAFNLRVILENDPAWKGVIGWCEFSARIFKRTPPPYGHASRGEWTDADDAELRFWTAERYGIEPKGQDLADAVAGVAHGARFHPVREYLDGLQWDGVSRIERWLEAYLGCTAWDGDETQDTATRQRGLRYVRRVGELILIQAVARVRSPGCKADYVLILEGSQGRRKSTSLRVLFGEDWFSDTPIDIGSKDAYESIRGLWCVELAELDSLNKADATRAKAFFSSASDRFRMPYGHRAQSFPRQCVVCGTTNQSAYLKDQTGNRRYWPVQCGEIDIEALAEMRDQLWAEADHRFKAGVAWWPQEEDREVFETEQDARVDADVWEPLVQAYLHQRIKQALPAQRRALFVTGAEIMKEALGMDPGAMRRPEQTRLGMILQTLGWRHCRPYGASGRVRGYRPSLGAIDAVAETERKTGDAGQEVVDAPIF